jgi:2-iminobutanoate/2-iminopropanoate deaminase
VGDLLFLSGQVASLPDGTVLRDSVTLQVRQALANLNEVATACGSSLNTTVQCRVYLRDLADFDEMDQEYRRHFADPMPARTTVQSNFSHFDVEIDAIIHAPQEDQ